MKIGNVKLSEYIKRLEDEGLEVRSQAGQCADKLVRYLSFDSQDIEEDTLFVCKGAAFKEQYLKDSLDKGAFCYVSEKEYDVDAPCIIVDDVRVAMTVLADIFYDSAWKKLKVVGITGTKGKSTTTYFMKSIVDHYMEQQGKPESAVLSGIDNYDGVIREESHLTTQEAMTIHRHFNNAVESGIEYLTMEVSSQALKYDRTRGIIFDVGAFLNIGEDHISPIEHPSIEDYINSKLVLMRQCKTAVINGDCEFAGRAVEEAEKAGAKVITYGITAEDSGTAGGTVAGIPDRKLDIEAYEMDPIGEGMKFRARGMGFDEEFSVGLSGVFNVPNALTAIAAARELGIPMDCIKEGLRTARVSGRMEVYRDAAGSKTVIVDYAHNQMSFEALFESVLMEYPGKDMTIVFGCPGKKALKRREDLGRLAGKYCKKTYITEEDAGEEPVDVISREIAGFVEAENGAYEMIEDRGEAIAKAIDEADENTIVLITGKGRETRQKRGREYIDVISDVEYVHKFLGI